MKSLSLIIAPVIWPKLPLLGSAYVLESLLSKGYKVSLYDINIDIYNKVKMNKKIKERWTQDYHHFTFNFFRDIFQLYKSYFDNLLKKFKKRNPSIIAFTVYKTNFLFSLELGKWLKQNLLETKLIFAGPHISYLCYYNHQYFNNLNWIDHFIIGEGEEITHTLISKKNREKVIHTSQIQDLNMLPFPRYKQFNLSSYERINSLPILFSRGCINKCHFCFEHKQFQTYKTRNPLLVIEEMKYHIKENKIHWFTFYDSLFNGNLKLLYQLLELIQKNNINIIWDAQISIRNDMDNDIFKLMKKTGCINLFVGLESGSESINLLMNKGFHMDQASSFFKKLKEHQLNFETSFIINYPGETEKDFQETINYIKQQKNIIKKIAQVNPYIYYPGTDVDYTQGYNFLKGLYKINTLLEVFKKEKIKYTNAYINNLIV